MKSLCLTLLTVFAFSPMMANGQSPFLRTTNNFGDYWAFRFVGNAINVEFDVDHVSQKLTDREMKITDIDIVASFLGSLTALEAVSSDEMPNMAYIKLYCKSSNPYCVYSHFESTKYNVLPIFCQVTNGQIGKGQIGADCAAFVQAALSVP